MQRAFSSPKCTAVTTAPRNVGARAGTGRRDVFLTGMAGVLAAPLVVPNSAQAAEQFSMRPEDLSTFERSGQRSDFLKRAEAEVMKVCTKDDARKALRLVFNDAATYDAATGVGGLDGSIVLNKEEMRRSENKGFEDLVKRLGQAKEKIDNGSRQLGAKDVTWADLMVIAAKATTQADWRDLKLKRASRPEGGDTIVRAFGSAWDLRLGRLDDDSAPPGHALGPNASTAEMKEFMLKLGVPPGKGQGFFSPKPPFWERRAFTIYPATQDDPLAYEQKLASEDKTFAGIKKEYDAERLSITRTNYEVDFIDNFTKLAALGAKFDKLAYLHPVTSFRLQ